MGRKEDDDKYQEFLQEPDKEKDFRDKVLRPGVVHDIHLHGDTEPDPIDLSGYYTKAEVDALLAALTAPLPTCLTTLARHNFLMYDEVEECWKNQLMDLDFEDSIDYTCTTMFEALVALIRIEDSYAGNTITVEDSI
ncbi:hypothetical protein LCGC14_0461080 [marine sediment metagenome]|uniref:Uncharacterized protein n=1 Tax=marine sediment metagenome TaxID=412755 RepID=A0A0F9V1Y0_9ZZZZ|nr:hypothetical protein [bacterium]